jgi:hypothetical protein
MELDFAAVEKKILRGDELPSISQTLAEELFDGFAQVGKTAAIARLVNAGYDPTSSNAYYFAAESGYLNILEYLDDIGYYRFPKDAMLAAESNGYDDVVTYIKEKYNF